MNYVPKSLSRFGYRQLLKLQKNSPTILVVTGVVGLGATAVMAAYATRKLDPILEEHAKSRFAISERTDLAQDYVYEDLDHRQEQKQLVKLYTHTGLEITKLYAPTIAVGTLSAASVLYGHRILKGRHLATMAAYSGLMEQFKAYRERVAETVGVEMEKEIHQGAVGKYEEDPEHPGEYKLKAKYDDKLHADYLRPFFDESNPNWTTDPTSNYLFLKGVQSHMNNLLQIRGHLFLFEVYDALSIPRVKESIVAGWIYGEQGKDNIVDFGFMTNNDPQTVLFRNGGERSVRLDFNVDGVIWDLI